MLDLKKMEAILYLLFLSFIQVNLLMRQSIVKDLLTGVNVPLGLGCGHNFKQISYTWNCTVF